MKTAFTNIRVVDCSGRLSGAWAGRLFGDLGAEVILVEPKDGHVLRQEPPFTEDGVSLMHAYANWNKLSVSVEHEKLENIVRSADVVITTTTDLPGCLEWCSDDVIHLSITPHGLTGPLADRTGNNLTACARVGWSAINQCEGEPPLQLPHNQTGYIAGVAGFVSASAALYRRLVKGGGERCDVSEMEAMSNTCAPWAQVGIFVGNNRMAHGPNGARARNRASPLWQCVNGAINFGYGEWKQWTSAFEFLGKPEIAHDPDLISPLGRYQKNTVSVRDELADAVSTMDKWVVFKGLAERHCISGAVQNAKELEENDHLNERDFYIETEISGNLAKAPGPFSKLSATPWRYSRPAPQFNEHLDENFERAKRSTTAIPGEGHDLPLKGIRVLTFTQAWSGTFGTQLLSLLGADVVQIESRKRPDVWRGVGTPVPPAIRNPEMSQNPLNTNGMYNTVNLNKRAITLDMASPEGKSMFWELVPRFDILCENFSPHVLNSWGVTLSTLREKRPDIIYASLSGYGHTGPYAEFPANGATTEPMAGLASIHGYEGDESQNTGGLIPDPITGFYFASSILAALHHRHNTGEGQRIDIAMMEAVAVNCGDAILDYSVNGQIRTPSGNRHPGVAPHNVYQTSDEQWIAIATETDEAFSVLAGIVGIETIGFESLEERKSEEKKLDELLGSWVESISLASVCTALAESQVTFAPVKEFESVYASPSNHYAERGFLVPVSHPESGTHFMPLNPWIYTNTPRGPISHSPCFGQHSQEVLAEELSVTEEDYLGLEQRGITGTTRL